MSEFIDESKAIKAKDIVDDPRLAYTLQRAYIMVMDTSMSMTFSNLIEAVNILNDAGWEAVTLTNYGSYMYVLMKNLNYKRKIQPEHDDVG